MFSRPRIQADIAVIPIFVNNPVMPAELKSEGERHSGADYPSCAYDHLFSPIFISAYLNRYWDPTEVIAQEACSRQVLSEG